MSDVLTSEPAGLDSLLSAFDKETPDANAAPAEAASNTGSGSDLTALLSEFDTATAKPTAGLAPAAPSKPTTEQTSAPADAAPLDPSRLLADAAETYVREHRFGKEPNPELRDKIDSLGNALSAMQAERTLALNKADYSNIVQRFKQALSEFDHLPEDFAETWVLAESIRNPQLREAFDNRYMSLQHQHYAERQSNKAARRIYQAAKSFPDRESSEDRAALTAWMLRGASQKAPEPPPPNYGAMTDAEFQKEKDRLGL